MKLIYGLAIAAITATTAFAHEGVTNEVVKKRMMLMDDVKNSMGVLGKMAKGAMDFDAEQAEAARAALEAHAKAIPAAFEAEESDPKSEAAPAIWTGWDDFVQKAMDMETAAQGMSTASLDGVRAGMGALGKSCKGCHSTYRAD